MPTITIPLKVRDTDEKPRIFKIVKGAFGSDNRIIIQFQVAAGTAYTLANRTCKIYLYNFQNIIQREFNLTITTPPGSDGIAYYDPLENDFGTDDLLYLRAEAKDTGNLKKDLTERVLFEVV